MKLDMPGGEYIMDGQRLTGSVSENSVVLGCSLLFLFVLPATFILCLRFWRKKPDEHTSIPGDNSADARIKTHINCLHPDDNIRYPNLQILRQGMEYKPRDIGALKFFVHMNHTTCLLSVTIKEGTNIWCRGNFGSSNTYVRVQIRPHESHFTTQVKEKNPNPKWNETFDFHIPEFAEHGDLRNKFLSLQVWYRYDLRKDEMLGEVLLDLSCCDYTSFQAKTMSLEHPFDKLGNIHSLGEIEISLAVDEFIKKFEITILRLKDLDKQDCKGQAKFEAVIFAGNGAEKYRFESRKALKTETTLNETFQVSIDSYNADPDLTKYHFTVFLVKSKHGVRSLVGAVELGLASSPQEARNFRQIIDDPGVKISYSYALSPVKTLRRKQGDERRIVEVIVTENYEKLIELFQLTG